MNFFLPFADDPAEADLWLLNSCTVKNPAEDHFRNSIKYLNTPNIHTLLLDFLPDLLTARAGCGFHSKLNRY